MQDRSYAKEQVRAFRSPSFILSGKKCGFEHDPSHGKKKDRSSLRVSSNFFRFDYETGDALTRPRRVLLIAPIQRRKTQLPPSLSLSPLITVQLRELNSALEFPRKRSPAFPPQNRRAKYKSLFPSSLRLKMGRKIEKCIKAFRVAWHKHFIIGICIGAFHVGGKKRRKGAERRIVTVEGRRGRSVDTVKEDEIKLI